MKRSHTITYFLLTLFKAWLSSISKRSRNRLADNMASLLYHHIRFRKELARKNLQRAFPEWSESKVNFTLIKVYVFFSQNFIDFISIPKSWDRIKLDVVGEEFLESSIEQKKGVVFITGHFGCWDGGISLKGEAMFYSPNNGCT